MAEMTQKKSFKSLIFIVAPCEQDIRYIKAQVRERF